MVTIKALGLIFRAEERGLNQELGTLRSFFFFPFRGWGVDRVPFYVPGSLGTPYIDQAVGFKGKHHYPCFIVCLISWFVLGFGF